jgi:hypothetical protein
MQIFARKCQLKIAPQTDPADTSNGSTYISSIDKAPSMPFATIFEHRIHAFTYPAPRAALLLARNPPS